MPKPRGIIPPEAMQRACEIFVKYFGQKRNMSVRVVEGTPELNIPDATLVLLDNQETGEIEVEYLPLTKQPKEPPSPRQH